MPYSGKPNELDTPMGYMRPLKREQFNLAAQVAPPSATGGAPKTVNTEANAIEQLPKITAPDDNFRPKDGLPILPRLMGSPRYFAADDYNITNTGFVQQIAQVLQNSMDDPVVSSVIGQDGDVNRFALDLVGYLQRSFEPPREPVPLPDQVAMSRTALRVHRWLNNLKNR